jgi:hypothetical protein
MEPPASSSSESLTSRSTESMEIDALSVMGNSPPRSVNFLAFVKALCSGLPARARSSSSIYVLPLHRASFSKVCIATSSFCVRSLPLSFSEVSRHSFHLLHLASELRVGLSDLFSSIPFRFIRNTLHVSSVVNFLIPNQNH